MPATWSDSSTTLLTASDAAIDGVVARDVGFNATNIASLVLRHAEATPQRAAFIGSGEGVDGVVTYRAFRSRVASFATELEVNGIGAGDRVLVLLPMSVDLYAIGIAILSAGATLTLVDGRLAPRRLIAALRDAAAHAVIASPSLMRWWPLVPSLWPARRFSLGGRVIGSTTLTGQGRASALRVAVADVRADHPAIVSFTSGSTGQAKAITRTHGVLVAQHEALARTFPTPPEDVNLPGFPVAALHNLCCGSATVLPPRMLLQEREEPRRADALAELVRKHGVTSLSGSPALLDALALSVLRSRRPLAKLCHIVVGGGPVSRRLCDRALRAFPGADARILYGATEAEPIATVSMTEGLVARGKGFLVGRAAGDVELALLDKRGAIVTDRHPRSGAGEVLVRGPHVVRGAAYDDAGTSWHRTGDIGAFDTRGRLWLLGRVGSSVMRRGRELHVYAVEAMILSIEGVRAAALVMHARAPEGELAVSLEPGADRATVMRAVRTGLVAMGCDTLPVRVCATIPMDARHGSKVVRERLAERLARSTR